MQGFFRPSSQALCLWPLRSSNLHNKLHLSMMSCITKAINRAKRVNPTTKTKAHCLSDHPVLPSLLVTTPLLEVTLLDNIWPLAEVSLPSLDMVVNMAGGEKGPANSVPGTGIRTPHTRIVYSVFGSRLLPWNWISDPEKMILASLSFTLVSETL